MSDGDYPATKLQLPTSSGSLYGGMLNGTYTTRPCVGHGRLPSSPAIPAPLPLVDPTGLEPATLAVQKRRSTN